MNIEETFLGMSCWKSDAYRNILLAICQAALSGEVIWPDSIDFSFVDAKDKNCIGACFKTMTSSHMRILERNENLHRRSKAPNANSRTLFAYNVVNPGLAKTFIQKFGKLETSLQLEMAV